MVLERNFSKLPVAGQTIITSQGITVMMENQKLHFSSPRQNSDFIVYHNRAKSSQSTSKPVQVEIKTSISVGLLHP